MGNNPSTPLVTTTVFGPALATSRATPHILSSLQPSISIITSTVSISLPPQIITTTIPIVNNPPPAAASPGVSQQPRLSVITESALPLTITSIITSNIIQTTIPIASTATTIIYVTLTETTLLIPPTVTASQTSALNGLPGASLGVLTMSSSSTTSIPAALAASAEPEALPSPSPFPNNLQPAGIVVTNKKLVGPFTPPEALLGGVPTRGLDVPVTAVFLVLFVIGAGTHFTIHELNSKRGHKFHLSDLVFDFCMVRNVTCIMRIVWAFRPNNNSVVLAALIFEGAGVVVLFAVNVLFTQRIIRAMHPNFGWHPIPSTFILVILASVPLIIFWNIINLTISFFLLNPAKVKIVKDLLIFGSAYTMFLSIFPIIFITFAAATPTSGRVENFGLGSFQAKVVILLSASAILFVGAIVRLVSNLVVRPKENPAPVDSKAVFYVTGFTLEIIVVILYAISRVDLRFWVPDGASKPGDYTVKEDDEESLFQDVDVKMRFSVDSQDSEVNRSDRWRDGRVDRTSATSEQVKRAIQNLQLNSQIVGHPIDNGDSELLVYAFRTRKNSVEGMSDEVENRLLPRPPRRSSTWLKRTRNTVRKSVF